MNQETTTKPISGYLVLLLVLILIGVDIWAFTMADFSIPFRILAIALIPFPPVCSPLSVTSRGYMFERGLVSK